MNIIKEFSEFNGPKDTALWKVEINSKAKTYGLTPEEIENVFNYYTHEEYVDFKTEYNKKTKEEYDKYPIAKWQLSKSVEVEKLFFTNVKYEIKGDVVYATTKFEIKFTDDFDRGDVIGWTEGFHRFAQLVPMVQIYNLVNKIEHSEVNKKERKFTEDLVRNEKWNVEKA